MTVHGSSGDAVTGQDRESLEVLNIVTTERPFFRQQVSAVARKGVSCTTVSVPGRFDPDTGTSRSLSHYVAFYGQVLGRALTGYDLVHANYGLTAPAALAQPVRPVVLTLWGSDVHGEYGWLSRRCAPHFDAVVVMSEELAEEIGDDCHVVPHCVDLDLFEPEPRRAAREALGWAPDEHHVLFPYSPRREVKDYPRAERVVERANERMEAPVRLHSVSDVPHERMPTYMNASDALLLTSRHEGSPNAVKEAMACNLPVVATDTGDVADLLADVSPSTVGTSDDELVDGLVWTLRSDTRSNGREAIGHLELDLDRMADRLVDIYRSALSARSRSEVM